MGLKAVAVIYAVLLGTSLTSAAAENKVCFSGVCIGATLAELPPSIKWEPFQVSPKNALFRGPEFDTAIPTVLRAEPPVLKQLMAYRDGMGNIGGLNQPVINALKSVRGSCVNFQLSGTFYSESHYLTKVTVRPYPVGNGQSQEFRVSQITRFYNDAVTDAQKTQLQSSLEQQFGVRFGAGGQPYDDHNRVNTAPNVFFNLGGPTTVNVTEPYATQAGTQNPDVYRALPGCTTQVKVD